MGGGGGWGVRWVVVECGVWDGWWWRLGCKVGGGGVWGVGWVVVETWV